jgi:hypothetical protein
MANIYKKTWPFFKPILMFAPNILCNSMHFWWQVLPIGMQFLQFQGIKNLEWFGVGKEELPGLATP